MPIRLREWLKGRRPGRFSMAVVGSLALHALLLAAVLFVKPPAHYVARRGDAMFVELPNPVEPAQRGMPGAPSSPPVESKVPPAPTPSAPARPAPPAPRVAAAPPAPAAPPAARPAPPAPPKAVEPPPAAPPRVASAPPPPTSDSGEPALRAAAPPDPSAEVPKPVAAAPARPAPPETPPAPAAPPSREASAPDARGSSQVAMVPPGAPSPAAPDIRSALRRGSGTGGAGGTGEGRGGIEGDPIPLDSKDPRYSDYLDRIRRMIKEKWGYPCVKNTATRECEYKTAQLVIEFGIAKDGKVPFVVVRRQSGYEIYDEYAVNAIKLASPFPPVPDSLGRKGIPIMATFSYVVESSLTNLLR